MTTGNSPTERVQVCSVYNDVWLTSTFAPPPIHGWLRTYTKIYWYSMEFQDTEPMVFRNEFIFNLSKLRLYLEKNQFKENINMSPENWLVYEQGCQVGFGELWRGVRFQQILLFASPTPHSYSNFIMILKAKKIPIYVKLRFPLFSTGNLSYRVTWSQNQKKSERLLFWHQPKSADSSIPIPAKKCRLFDFNSDSTVLPMGSNISRSFVFCYIDIHLRILAFTTWPT